MKESAVAWLVLAVIISAGIFIRAAAVGEPMWLDECHTAWAVDSDSPAIVASRGADGNQPPLYLLLVWAVTNVFGLTEFSLRLISLVAGSAMMIIASFWARSLTNRWSAAILAAGLIAFDGQFIFYATEARCYALVQLIGLIQAIFFWRILASELDRESDAKQSAAVYVGLLIWALLSIAILYCHYTSVWLLIVEAIFVVVLSIIRRSMSVKFFVAGMAVIAATVPMWFNVSTVFDRRSNWSAVSSNAQLWIDVEPWLVHWILIPLGFAFAAWMISLIQPKQEPSTDRNPQWILWSWIVLWAIIGPISIATAELLGVAPLALVRYSIVCWVAMALFATMPLKFASERVSWVIALIILGSSFFGNWWAEELVGFKRLPIFRDEDWVSTVSELAESNSSEPIFQFADVIEDIDALSIPDERFQEYLLFPIRGANAVHGSTFQQRVVALPTWNPQFTAEHINWIRDAKGCWLIVRGEVDYALILPETLEDHLGQSIEFKFIPNERKPDSQVHLIRVRVKPSND